VKENHGAFAMICTVIKDNFASPFCSPGISAFFLTVSFLQEDKRAVLMLQPPKHGAAF